MTPDASSAKSYQPGAAHGDIGQIHTSDQGPHRSKKVLAISVVALLVIIAIIVVLIVLGFRTGRLYAGYKQTGTKLAVAPQVCGSDVVDQFNKALPETASKPAALKSLATSIASRPNYQQDATCVAIEFIYYQQAGNVQKTNQYYTLAKQLNDKGQYPNNALSEIISLPFMNDMVKSLQPGGSAPKNAHGIG